MAPYLPDALERGWANLAFQGHLFGPLAALAKALGFVQVSALICGGAVISLFGSGPVSTASNARLTLAMARSRLFPGCQYIVN